ncbi:DNA-invertase [Escherichia coli]|nr:DNA-invertase [Escherichia coli]
MGRFFFHIMGALAEMERELIVERNSRRISYSKGAGENWWTPSEAIPRAVGAGRAIDCGRRITQTSSTDF